MQRWVLEAEEGKVALANQLVVFSNTNNIIGCKITCLTPVSNEMKVSNKLKVLEEWDTYISSWVKVKAPKSLSSIIHSAGTFWQIAKS